MVDGNARLHPSEAVALACERWGETDVALRAASLLSGSLDDVELIDVLAHPSPEWLARPVNAYWPRVWGARVFLYAWHPDVIPVVVAGLGDDHWRVREMCAKVAALRELGEAADGVAAHVGDHVPRVRVAMLRALAAVGEAEHVPALLDLVHDPEARVRAAAERGLGQLEGRLDRRFDPH